MTPFERALADLPGAVVPTGECRECQCRVPLRRSGLTVLHWHRREELRLVPPDLTDPLGLRWFTRRVRCAGSYGPAEKVLIYQYEKPGPA